MLEDRVEVARARISLPGRSAYSDRLVARLRLASQLGSADLQPPVIPPSAILIVRRLAEPRLGRLALRPDASRLDVRWEHAARQALADLYRRAARPLDRTVPPHAEAVRFADDGELLACLARDLAAGEARGRWWWDGLRHRLPAAEPEAMVALLCRYAREVPAALHRLAQRGEALTVANALPPGGARQVLLALAWAHQVPDLIPELPVARRSEGARPRSSPPPRAEPAVEPIRRAVGASDPPPWQEWSADLLTEELAPERAAFLGVGLGLYRRPDVVRGAAFAQHVRQWWASALAPEPAEPRAATDDRRAPGQQDASSRTGDGWDVPIARSSPPASGVDSPLRPPEPSNGYRESDEREIVERANSSRTGEPDPTTARPSPSPPFANATAPGAALAEPALPSDVAAPDIDTPTSRAPRPSASESDSEPPALDFEDGVETTLGGALFLINLMCQLDLPECFEDTWELASALGPWGTLDALVRGLLGRHSASLPTDPLWSALAALAGRTTPPQYPASGESEPSSPPPLGHRLPEVEDFRLPRAWLALVGDEADGRFAWTTDHGRFCLWSERGYALVEEPARADASAQAREALARLLDTRDPPTAVPATSAVAPIADVRPLTGQVSPALARWLSLVLPYVTLRLRRALGAEPDDDLVRAVLRRTGRLHVTSTHVDLVLRLDDISVPVRIAGLDRDPGWLPAFGRVVKFHFR